MIAGSGRGDKAAFRHQFVGSVPGGDLRDGVGAGDKVQVGIFSVKTVEAVDGVQRVRIAFAVDLHGGNGETPDPFYGEVHHVQAVFRRGDDPLFFVGRIP